MASRPPSPDDPTVASADDSVVPELDEKRLANTANRTGGSKPAASSPADDDDDEDEHDVEDDEDDEELVVFTAKEAAGALATIYAFVKPFLNPSLPWESGPWWLWSAGRRA